MALSLIYKAVKGVAPSYTSHFFRSRNALNIIKQ